MATNMFRLLGRLAVKATPGPVLRLSSGTSRRVHSVQLPYRRPPSYDTIARRFFSSDIDPPAFFARKHQQEAKARGEYLEIHDIGGIAPKEFDVLITDIDHRKLRHEIAEPVGIPYYLEATKEDANRIIEAGDCIIYAQTSTLFGIKHGNYGPTPVKIAGHLHGVCRSSDSSHFTDANIIGMDFCNMRHVSQWNDFKDRRAKLYIGAKWRVVEEPKL